MKSNRDTRIFSSKDRLLTAQEVAQLINASDTSVYKMALRGEIPCVKITARMVRFDQDEIEEWLESKKQK